MINRRIVRPAYPGPFAILDNLGAFWDCWVPELGFLYQDTGAVTPVISELNSVAAWKSLKGTLAIQNTSTSRPVFRRSLYSQVSWLEGRTVASKLTITFSGNLGSQCTVAFVSPFGVVFDENQIINSTYDFSLRFIFGSAFIVVNRALTTSEKSALALFLNPWVPQLGSERVVNGTFNTNMVGWNVSSGATAEAVSGVMQGNSGPNGSQIISQIISTSVGKSYASSCTVLPTVGSWRLIYGTAVPNFTTTAKTVRNVFSPAIASVSLALLVGTVNRSLSADNISFREIL